MIPSMIALPISGTVVEMIGQKRTLIIGQILILLGWTVVYFAKQFLILLIGRFLMGLGIGTCLPVTILLNSEIALIKMRGTLSMMGSLAMSIGVIYSLLMAATFPLKHLFILVPIIYNFFNSRYYIRRRQDINRVFLHLADAPIFSSSFINQSTMYFFQENVPLKVTSVYILMGIRLPSMKYSMLGTIQ